MASSYNASGGYYNGIWTLVPPECHQLVDPGSASQQGSEEFLITRWRDYVGTLMVDLAPGIVLGSISAAGFLLFVFGAFMRHGRRHKIRAARLRKREGREAAKQAKQAAVEGGTAAGQADVGGKGEGDRKGAPQAQCLTAAEPAGELELEAAHEQQAQQAKQQGKRLTAGRLLKWAIVLFALATIGVCAWGLAESVIATHGLVDDFWLLVQRAREIVVDLEASLARLGEGLGEVAATLDSVQGVLQTVVDTVNGIPIIGGLIGRVLPMDSINEVLGPTADSAIVAMAGAANTINDTVVPIINDQVLPAIDSVLKNEGWTTNLQDTWWYIVIAVLFGLLILVSAAVAFASYRMRRGVLATCLVAALWAVNAVVMFVGLGMLNGAKSVANDACLYSEDYVSRLVEQNLEGEAREIAANALDYYFGRVGLVDSSGAPLLTNGTQGCDAELTAALLKQILGLDLGEPLVFAWRVAELLPSISGLLGGLSLPTIPLVNFDLDTIKEPVLQASDQLQGLLEDVCNVTQLLVRENHIWPLYVDAKTYVCCDLTQALHNIWVPWTVAGVLALVLSLLASIRVVTSTLSPHGGAGKGKETGTEGGGSGELEGPQAQPAGPAGALQG